MRTLLNIIWLVFAGFWLALGYALAGVICCILIITIPFGIASFRMASYVIWPFGREVVRRSDAGAGSTIGNIIWFIVAGWWLVIEHIITAIPLFISIIGIPMGWANLKLIPISLTPFGREIVETHRPFAS
ncbi:YccF domain-containing protein [Ruania suaedae]|uniref:YccF domain-containing protein n=1 Tax=Ruania suaedae TaxID=2897774 RepID=UPI001E4D4B9B|nr:YccF domain-containing protein [Ruania suaedae]UFU02036.1 YccF domain-containing protein [Ruania suaedae]